MSATTVAWNVSPTPTETAPASMIVAGALPLNAIHFPDLGPEHADDGGPLPASDHDVSAQDLEPHPRRERLAGAVLDRDRVAPRRPRRAARRARRHGRADRVGSRRGGGQRRERPGTRDPGAASSDHLSGCGVERLQAVARRAAAGGAPRARGSSGAQNENSRYTPTATSASASGTPTAVSAYVIAASTPPTPPSGSGRIIAACPARTRAPAPEAEPSRRPSAATPTGTRESPTQ